MARNEDALCEMLERALLNSGLSADIAKVVSRAGCEALVRPGGRLARRKGSQLVSKVKTKAKRKVSAYQKAVGRHLKALKKKHPRTPVTKLMKKAHRLAKRSRK